MTEVRKSYREPLSEEMLFQWHRMLLGWSGGIELGAWRSHAEPMQVLSGPLGKETVHFEAPPSESVPAEMARFIGWFNETPGGGLRDAFVHSALAHLYFESIHPFEDGNGRIGRALAEKALSRGMGRPVVMSLSQAIEADKKSYYRALQYAQRSNEVTDWIEYFVKTALQAQTQTEAQIEFTLKKARFFDRFRDKLNERQHKVIHRILEEGPDGFEGGGVNARKYVAIAKTSKPTATRDLQHLLEIGAFEPFGTAGGRSTSYRVSL